MTKRKTKTLVAWLPVYLGYHDYPRTRTEYDEMIAGELEVGMRIPAEIEDTIPVRFTATIKVPKTNPKKRREGEAR